MAKWSPVPIKEDNRKRRWIQSIYRALLVSVKTFALVFYTIFFKRKIPIKYVLVKKKKVWKFCNIKMKYATYIVIDFLVIFSPKMLCDLIWNLYSFSIIYTLYSDVIPYFNQSIKDIVQNQILFGEISNFQKRGWTIGNCIFSDSLITTPHLNY